MTEEAKLKEWAHSLEYAAGVLDIGKNSMIRMEMEEIARMTKAEASKFEDHILVFYDGNFSQHISDYLKERHGVHTYVLLGGIGQYEQESK